jgi:uncharacterized membrane protein YcaP (DUF421 family)
MDAISLLLRVSIMYVYALTLIRLAGKRSIGNLSPFDFVMATMIGDFFDDVFWAEVPLIQGLVAVATLIALHVLVAHATFRIGRLRRWLEGTKTPIIQQGRFLLAGLHHERTSRDSVLSALRMQRLSQDELNHIKEANWEPSGQLSVLRSEEARPAQKRDELT